MINPKWRTAHNILCLRLDTWGDVLMTTPAIRAIRESFAGSRITLLTSPAGAEAGHLIPEVDTVEVYQSPWMKATPPRVDARHEFVQLEWLRANQFDAAVIFTVFSQNPLPAALLCYLADIPLRLAHCRENPYQLLTDWAPELEPDQLERHEVRRQLDLVESIGCRTCDTRLSIRVSRDAMLRVARKLRRLGISADRPFVVVHPGASAASRRYPASAFASVVRELRSVHNHQIVLTGGAHEAELIDEVRREADTACCSLAGNLSLDELAALLQ